MRPGASLKHRPAGLSALDTSSHNVVEKTSSKGHVGAEESDMSDKVYDVPPEWTKRAFIDESQYQKMYERSLAYPNGFWA